MKDKPNLSFWKLWNLSFGFFGVQIAYALQSSQVSRIFSTIGADPHDLSYFWILPPLMGLVVQPIVGSASDRTWNRFGRRLPYLIVGALVAIIVMCFLPNAGSLGLSVSQAIIFGLVMLMFLDTSINMAMQPFKMLVGDFVNEKQKGLAYSIQSFLCNAGSVVGYIAPIILAMFLSNTAPSGEVPPTVTFSFYLGAAVMLLCVIYTFAKVKEMPPHEYALYHGISEKLADKKDNPGMLKLLVKASKVFWTVGLVQFFCWAAFLYMWTYSTDAIASHAFDAPSIEQVTGITVNGKSYDDKYIFNDKTPVIIDGTLALAGIEVDGTVVEPQVVVVEGDTVISAGRVVYDNGIARVSPDKGLLARAGSVIYVDGVETPVRENAYTVSEFSRVVPGTELTLAHIAKDVDGTGDYVLEQTEHHRGASARRTASSSITRPSSTPPASNIRTPATGTASSLPSRPSPPCFGLLSSPVSATAVWAIRFSLLIGAASFISVYFIHNHYALGVSYALMGCAWAAILAMPFTILTNALSGSHIGTYLGLFNCTICIPQIVAALCGGLILHCFPPAANGAPQTVCMLVVSGVLLAIASLAVWNIKETFGSRESQS